MMLRRGLCVAGGRLLSSTRPVLAQTVKPRASSINYDNSIPILRFYATKQALKDLNIDLPPYSPPTPEEWAQIDHGASWQDALKEKLVAEPGSIQARSIYYQDEDIVVIYDRYPKAHVHFLIVPKRPEQAVDHLQQLTPNHLKLLEKYATVSSLIADKLSKSDPLLLNFYKLHGHVFQAGFHAVPSLSPIHMHLISRDMHSPSLKTAVHYLSFTTPFFIPLSEVYSELKKTKAFSIKGHLEDHVHGDLVCHLDQKPFKRKMAKLREHLMALWARNEADLRGEPIEPLWTPPPPGEEPLEDAEAPAEIVPEATASTKKPRSKETKAEL